MACLTGCYFASVTMASAAFFWDCVFGAILKMFLDEGFCLEKHTVMAYFPLSLHVNSLEFVSGWECEDCGLSGAMLVQTMGEGCARSARNYACVSFTTRAAGCVFCPCGRLIAILRAWKIHSKLLVVKSEHETSQNIQIAQHFKLDVYEMVLWVTHLFNWNSRVHLRHKNNVLLLQYIVYIFTWNVPIMIAMVSTIGLTPYVQKNHCRLPVQLWKIKENNLFLQITSCTVTLVWSHAFVSLFCRLYPVSARLHLSLPLLEDPPKFCLGHTAQTCPQDWWTTVPVVSKCLQCR